MIQVCDSEKRQSTPSVRFAAACFSKCSQRHDNKTSYSKRSKQKCKYGIWVSRITRFLEKIIGCENTNVYSGSPDGVQQNRHQERCMLDEISISFQSYFMNIIYIHYTDKIHILTIVEKVHRHIHTYAHMESVHYISLRIALCLIVLLHGHNCFTHTHRYLKFEYYFDLRWTTILANQVRFLGVPREVVTGLPRL